MPNPLSPWQGDITGSSLPVRITFITYWILVLAGAVLATAVLSGLESRLTNRYASGSDAIAYRLSQTLANNGTLTANDLAAELAASRAELEIEQIEVVLPGPRTLASGAVRSGTYTESRRISMPDGGALEVLLHHPPMAELVAAARKSLLLAMGGGVILFGLVLHAMLRRMVSRPFQQLINAARATTAGDPGQRFDEGMEHEFGYLARFVNEALDGLRTHQHDLENTLTSLRQSESALSNEKERAEVTLSSIGDAVLTTDAGEKVEFLNPAAERLTGWVSANARGRPLAEVVTLMDESADKPLESVVGRCLSQAGPVTVDEHVLLKTRNGDHAVMVSAAPIRGGDARVLGAVMVLRDVAALRKLTHQLSWQASHDALTGLANRHEFERQMELALNESKSSGALHVLCYLDLDQFKIVNDSCGHAAGDELLRQITTMLEKEIRGADVFARIGGDEFAVLLKGCVPEVARNIADRFLYVVRGHPFQWEGKSFEVGVSIGMVVIDAAGGGVSEWLSRADVACFSAKDEGRNRVFFPAADDALIAQRRGEMQWVPRLRKALSEDRFQLYAQRIVPVTALKDDRPLYAEVLLRLLDEDGKLLAPAQFLPAAERYGLVKEIDRWVFRNVLKHLEHAGVLDDGCSYTVNLSGQSLGDDDFLEFVVSELGRSAVNPRQLCFEITETAAVANVARAEIFLSALHGMGCRFALDDFGTGVSSFGYLKSLKVDYLKIAGNFVVNIAKDPLERTIVSSIQQVGRALGLRTVAECVESEAILMHLRALGVDYAQGYSAHKPEPFMDVLHDRMTARAVVARTAPASE